MLQHLLIKDLAVIDSADIHFNAGMTTITGETGAGKSILLDALNLALGERSDSQLIRPGALQADITATFEVSSKAVDWLTAHALQDDHQCIIRRILYPNGRSRAFINGHPVTTQQLRTLGEKLIQIHGQHQHQLLLKPSEQLRILDAFGQHGEWLNAVKDCFEQWQQLNKAHQLLSQQNQTEQAKMDLLHYQIAELTTLNLGEQELAQLYQAHDKLAHAHHYITNCNQALSLLENQPHSALSLINHAQQVLQSVKMPNVFQCLESAQIQLRESISEITHFVEQLEIDPTRLQQLHNRLERIHELARKHKVEPLNLYSHFQQLKAQAEQCAQLQIKLEQLSQALLDAEQHYQSHALQLTQARQHSALQLAEKITYTLSALMPAAQFTIQLVPHTHLHPQGNETVLFTISTNPGHAPQVMQKIVSGGELSRISLALQLVSANFLATPCLVFDEVDVGISGKTGALVAKALHDLAQFSQVLCITHLPQVAAYGDQQLQVTKTQHAHSTTSEIHALNFDERVEEIAKLLGGMKVTPQALANAKQLLSRQEKETV